MTPEKRQEFVACYEAYYWRYSRVPTTSNQINVEFGTQFKEADYDDVLTKESLIKYFNERAIPNPKAPQPVLTPKQLDLLRAVCDPADHRTLAMKMKQVQVSQAELASWMRDASFARLMREETTRQFSDSRTYILNGLAREAAKGNVQAIKLWAEMTGEYVPGTQQHLHVSVETKEVVQKLLEVLQRHVPSELLELVTSEMEQVLFPQMPAQEQRWRPPAETKQLVTVTSYEDDIL